MYLLTENFNKGMDARRMAITSKPGTLQELINCHITRGGEIEKRKAFVKVATLPTGTFGLHAVNGQLITFGSAASVTLPNILGYQLSYNRLYPGGASATLKLAEAPTASAMVVRERAYRLKVTMPKQGNLQKRAFTFSFPAGVTTGEKPPDGTYTPTKIDDNSFYIDTGSVNTTSGVVVKTLLKAAQGPRVQAVYGTSTASESELTSKDATITFANAAQFGYSQSLSCSGLFGQLNITGIDASGLGVGQVVSGSGVQAETTIAAIDAENDTITLSKALTGPVTSITVAFPPRAYLFFPEQPSESRVYELFETTATEFAIYHSNLLTSSTKVYVAPALIGLSVSGIQLLSSSEVSWVFSTDGTSDAEATSIKLTDAINARIAEHGVLAEYSQGSIILTGSILPGSTVTVNSRGITLSSATAFTNNGTNMTRLLSTENYGGRVYAIAQFDGSKIQHFFDAKRVSSWDKIAASGSLTGVAAALAAAIYKEGEYSATALNGVVTINFEVVGQAYSIAVATQNGGTNANQKMTISTVAATETTAQVTVITLSGTYEANDIFNVTVGPSVYSVQAQLSALGTFARTYNNKIYSIAGSLLYFSETDTNGGPSAFTNDTLKGAGVINLANQDSGSESLTSIAVYQGKLAIFSRTAVQVWTMNADPKQNLQSQILNNIGTFAPKSVVAQGNVDTYFLSSSGIRSLRARDASNVAIVSDIGTAVDDMVLADLALLTQEQRNSAIGLIDPIEGRYWLALGQKIYVYSYFPTPDIAAWSVYQPGFSVDAIAILNNRIFIRSDADVYLYGGSSGDVYDTSEAIVTMPYLDGGKPAHCKSLTAIDSACVGKWEVYSGMDVSAQDARDYIGTIENSTYSFGRIMATGLGTHIGIQMRHKTAEYAKIGNFAAHFEINDAG